MAMPYTVRIMQGEKNDIRHVQYSPEWYAGFQNNTVLSAQVIVPIVMDLIGPRSVVDFGCGTGGWLSVFKEQGVADIHGVDGPWVDPERLLIPAAQFEPVDLAAPFALDIHADLAMSLEVAEHIPASAAPTFVKNLTDIAPVVLFSAAIPHQGGTGHHNEQWPSYWAALFKERGYVPVDCIRRVVWNDKRVRYWYAQNTFIFVREDALSRYPKLAALYSKDEEVLPLVHPARFLAFYTPKRPLLRRIVGRLRRMMGMARA